MDFYKSLVPQIEVIVVIGRTINSEKTARYGKLSTEFFKNAAICLIHPTDSKRLGMKEGNIKIHTKNGSVVVKAVVNEFETSEGMIVIPCGPWANKIIDEKVFQTGQPWFHANIETTKEEILKLDKIFQELKGGN
jgi:formylmethanofuran dehydrogenase subunit D